MKKWMNTEILFISLLIKNLLYFKNFTILKNIKNYQI